MSRLTLSIVLLLAVVACDSGPSAGQGERPVSPQVVALPAATFTARSQLWAPEYHGLAAYGLQLHLVENADACGDPEGLVQRAGVPWFTLQVLSPAVGVECPLFDPSAPDLPGGCIAFASAYLLDERGNQYEAPAFSGSVRISRADGARLSGAVRGWFPGGFFNQYGCEVSYAGSPGHETFLGGSCQCDGPEGARTCEMSALEDPCCDDELGLAEVEIPFEADACEAASDCWFGPCPPAALAPGCDPSPAPPADCIEACDGFDRVCRACAQCPEDDTTCLLAAGCDVPSCLDACRGVLAHDPVVATALRCFEASGGCDSWRSCMAGCGDT